MYTTASGVFQPVVSRFVAEARGKGQEDAIPAIFQSFLRAAFWLGLILGTLVFLSAGVIGQFLNLPAWTIQISAGLIFLSTLRPIAAGALQGGENFISFGITRLALSFARIIIVFLLVRAGLGLTGAVIALPLGWLVSVLCGFLLLGRTFWARSKRAWQSLVREGMKLSFYALLAYIAYMSLTSLDLVWVNRNLNGELAGAYAGLVLMRRIVALLPGVAVTVMFPRVVRSLAAGKLPTRILAQTAAIILTVSGTLSILYFIFNDQLIAIIFGSEYQAGVSFAWLDGPCDDRRLVEFDLVELLSCGEAARFCDPIGACHRIRMDSFEPAFHLPCKARSLPLGRQAGCSVLPGSCFIFSNLGDCHDRMLRIRFRNETTQCLISTNSIASIITGWKISGHAGQIHPDMRRRFTSSVSLLFSTATMKTFWRLRPSQSRCIPPGTSRWSHPGVFISPFTIRTLCLNLHPNVLSILSSTRVRTIGSRLTCASGATVLSI